MQAVDESVATLNGILVACLLDLNATEAMDGIRGLFDKNCVDLTVAGDLENVEIELGFRDQRSTPKVNYFELEKQRRQQVGESLNSDDLYETLNDYLQRYGDDDSILDASELDGYFAALACAPNTIMPSTWMPYIWGPSDSPNWNGQKDLESFTEAVFDHYNQVIQSLSDNYYHMSPAPMPASRSASLCRRNFQVFFKLFFQQERC